MHKHVSAAQLALLFLAGAATPAHAQFTTFDSRAAFDAAATGPLQTNPFDMTFELVPTSGGMFDLGFGTVTFDANHDGMSIGGGDLFGELHPEGSSAPQFIRFDFAAPVTSFGADFSLFDFPGITLDAMIGGSTFNFEEGFFGVIADTPFSWLTLQNASDESFFLMDDLSVGAMAVVPEPSTIWLTLAGSLLLVVAGRSRRNASRR